eukprot:scaffold85086_cov45-Prasinocladus_malaysianus.AAC.2
MSLKQSRSGAAPRSDAPWRWLARSSAARGSQRSLASRPSPPQSSPSLRHPVESECPGITTVKTLSHNASPATHACLSTAQREEMA